MKLYLDIETTPLPPEQRLFTKPIFDKMSFGNTKDPDKKQAKFEETLKVWETGSDAALKATTGEVALIGFAEDKKDYRYVAGAEIDMLKDLWGFSNEHFRENGFIIIGHNIIAFDLPFLIRRSLIQGVKVPDWILNDLNQYRPNVIKDTLRYWQFGDRRYYESLENICGAFGIRVKDSPVTGATFYEWWAKDKAVAIEYNKQDVLAMRELANRMEL